jgi:ribosomal protein L24
VLSLSADRVRVDKVAMQKVHLKPGRKAARGGGILEREGTIHKSNVMLVDPDSGKPSRLRNQRDESGKRNFWRSVASETDAHRAGTPGCGAVCGFVMDGCPVAPGV